MNYHVLTILWIFNGLYFHVHVLFFFAQSSGNTDGDDVSYLLWFASVSTHSGVLLSDWSLYTMGVHCVCVVFALLFNIVPVKSSKTDEDHLSIWISKKKRFSLQNGFAWGTSYPEKVAIIPSSIILWNFHVLFSPPQSFPILSNFEAKICTQCACMVYVVSALLIHIVPSKSSKIIGIIWRYCLKKKGFLYKMGVHTPLVSTKWACMPPWSLFSC